MWERPPRKNGDENEAQNDDDDEEGDGEEESGEDEKGKEESGEDEEGEEESGEDEEGEEDDEAPVLYKCRQGAWGQTWMLKYLCRYVIQSMCRSLF